MKVRSSTLNWRQTQHCFCWLPVCFFQHRMCIACGTGWQRDRKTVSLVAIASSFLPDLFRSHLQRGGSSSSLPFPVGWPLLVGFVLRASPWRPSDSLCRCSVRLSSRHLGFGMGHSLPSGKVPAVGPLARLARVACWRAPAPRTPAIECDGGPPGVLAHSPCIEGHYDCAGSREITIHMHRRC